MRILNWVNRKFHNKDHAWDLEGAKKAEHVAHTLIEQDDGLGDVIDSWKQGILTIGTFGYEPLKDFTQLKRIQLIDNNRQVEKDEEDDDDVDDEQLSYVESFEDEEEFDREHNPLVLHAFKHAFTTSTNGRSHCNQDFNNNVQESEIMVLNTEQHTPSLAFHDNKTGKRVTLADLFSADFEENNVGTKQNRGDHGKDQVEDIKKQHDEKHEKAKLSFGKNLIPRVKENSNSHSRPIKKIHRMMTKMLKKKIHPELEGKNQKKVNQMKHSEGEGIEMVSLLQTQGHVTVSSA